MTNKEMALRNYGLWTAEMLAKAVAKGKLTSADYEEITGEAYPADGEISAEEALNEIEEVLA